MKDAQYDNSRNKQTQPATNLQTWNQRPTDRCLLMFVLRTSIDETDWMPFDNSYQDYHLFLRFCLKRSQVAKMRREFVCMRTISFWSSRYDTVAKHDHKRCLQKCLFCGLFVFTRKSQTHIFHWNEFELFTLYLCSLAAFLWSLIASRQRVSLQTLIWLIHSTLPRIGICQNAVFSSVSQEAGEALL